MQVKLNDMKYSSSCVVFYTEKKGYNKTWRNESVYPLPIAVNLTMAGK